MRSSKDGDQLGSKLGPKLVSLVSQSVISTKRGLFDTEHKLRVKSMQSIIDRMGIESAEVAAPFIARILAAHGDELDPLLRDYFETVAGGQDQMKSIEGLFFGGLGSALSQVVSNYASAVTYPLNELKPNLVNDVGNLASAVALGIQDYDNALLNAHYQGLQTGSFDVLVDLAQNPPSVDDLAQFVNRGYMSEDDANAWLTRLGIPTTFKQFYQNLRTNILSPADASLGVLRGDLTLAQGRQIANENGFTDDQFNTLLLNTGEPLGLMQLLEAYRRKFISLDQLKAGILQSRIRDQWVDTAVALAVEPPSTADAIEASVQGYITQDQAKEIALQNGLEEEWFDAMWLTAGEPLSRTEMTDLVNRGYATEDQYKDALRQSRLKDSYINLSVDLIKRPMTISDALEANVQGYLTDDQADKIMDMNGLRTEDQPILRESVGDPLSLTEMLRLWNRGEVTQDQVEQALRESRLKDKYIPYALKLRTELPGLYDIRLMVSEGAIDTAAATNLLVELGYPSDLIKQLIAAFSGSSTTASKAVTESMLADLYLETAITATEFVSALKALGYSDANAALILEVNDWKAELAARNALMAKVRTQYVSGKIDKNTAQNDLLAAIIPASVVDKVLADWDLILAANVKTLTAAQVVSAWQLNLFESNDPNANLQLAVGYLVKLGYSTSDANILLAIKNGGPLESSSAKPTSKTSKSNQSASGAAS
jgi:hypothetical protein